MNFANTIKTYILQIINSIRFCDIFIGEVINDIPLSIKVNDNLFLNSDYVIKSSRFQNNFTKGKKIILIRETGGQKYYAIDYILAEED